MRFFAILTTSIMFATSSFAGEQEDVSKCISAAKRYADVTLSRSNYKYDGGWLSSVVTWYGNTPALCELGSKVRKLVISGQTYIVDGFAGTKARSIYSMKESELESIERSSEALAEKYNKFLTGMRAQLQSPKPDLDKIQSDFDTQIADIKLRILGTTEQLETAFSSDAVSTKLRAQIKELENKYREVSQEFRKVQAEQIASTPPDIQQLRDQLSKLKKSIESDQKSSAQKDDLNKELEQQVTDLSIEKIVESAKIEAKYKDTVAQLTTEVANLKDELSAYKTPVAPLIEGILSEISDEKFDAAYAGILSLRELPLYDANTNDDFIDAATAAVRPIPSSEYDRNLAAYKFLLKLAPENSKYLEKVNSYEQKIADAKEKKQIDDIVELISGSDDLSKYRTKMAKAVLELIKTGKCSRKQVEYYGVWVKSSERKGQYFMDCGSQRVWFDPKSNTGVYADRAISESRASAMCRNAISMQVLASPNFHFFDTSYTVHDPRKAVTYVQGFDVKNAFGTKMKYRAYCLIQPTGDLDLSLVNK
jgi:archaellum component FlaC